MDDRWLLINAHIREDLKSAELEWIIAQRTPQVRQAVEQGSVELGLFDDRHLGLHERYPKEPLILCRNLAVVERNRQKHWELLQKTEEALRKIIKAVECEGRPLCGTEISPWVGRDVIRYKMKRHFDLDISDEHFSNTLKVLRQLTRCMGVCHLHESGDETEVPKW